MVDQWLHILPSLLLHNQWFAPLAALFAGVITSFTPCSLTSIPLVLGYLDGSGGRGARRAFRISLVFAFGMTVTFAVVGLFASLLGKLLHHLGPWWYIGLGIIMVLMALQILEIKNFIPLAFSYEKGMGRGYAGAFLSGTIGGVLASHCALPVLVVLLAIAAESGNVGRGILLLLLYSLGHSTLVLMTGTSLGFIRNWAESKRYHSFFKVIRFVLGGIVFALAAYMFYLAAFSGLH
jgi:cytochrome c-type biogenesis protein